MDEQHAARLRALAKAWRAAVAVVDDDRETLEAAMEAAERDGMSVREIARYTGLHPSTAHGIVIRRTAARQARVQGDLGLGA